jgi:hypothetical protein
MGVQNLRHPQRVVKASKPLPVLLSFYELSHSENCSSFAEISERQDKDVDPLSLGVCRNGVDGYVFFLLSFRGM